MALKINTIRENKAGKNHDVPDQASMFSMQTISSEVIIIGGKVLSANITVTCIVTRHFRDIANPDHSAWTQTYFAKADVVGNWYVEIDELDEGKYICVVSAEGEDYDCVFLDCQNKGIVRICCSITGVPTHTPAQITVTGTTIYPPEDVHCTLCQIDAHGKPIGQPVSQTVPSPAGNWTVNFYPAAGNQFNGLYSFSASAYEGRASSQISVP
jgi:hypothetical protein